MNACIHTLKNTNSDTFGTEQERAPYLGGSRREDPYRRDDYADRDPYARSANMLRSSERNNDINDDFRDSRREREREYNRPPSPVPARSAPYE